MTRSLNACVRASVLALVWAVGSPALAQSIDCAKAASVIEKMVCGDSELKALDSRMADLYAKALKALPPAEQTNLRGEQREWIKTREECVAATEPRRTCVSYAYTQRNSRLEGLLSSPSAQPAPAGGSAAANTTGPTAITPGQAPIVQKGTVVGRGEVTYTVPGRKGQTLVVDLQTARTSLYFNVLPAGSQEAIYASDRAETGNRSAIVLPADGDYRVVVYLFRNEARRGTKAEFAISLSLK